MSEPWWITRPGVLEGEVTAFRQRGIPHAVDRTAEAEGVLAIDAAVRLDGQSIAIRVIYPDLYPFVRFEAFAPSLRLARHQHPFNGNLCLIGRATENWDLYATAAEFLTEQLPRVLAAAGIGLDDPPAALEEAQGEPYSDYYATQEGSALFVDSSWHIPPDIRRGRLRLLVDPRVRLIGDSLRGLDAPMLRGTVAEILDEEGIVLARADPALLASVPEAVTLSARWMRVERPPPQSSPPAGLAEFEVAIDSAWRATRREAFGKNFGLDVVGLVFPEEVRYRHMADGWLFFVRAYRGKNPKGVLYLAKSYRVGRQDLAARTPEVATLAAKRVAIVGVGGIGATIALELARAGVGELRLLDHDVVDPATAVRYPFGFAAAGQAKVNVLGDWIKDNLPYTMVQRFQHRLGGVRHDTRSESDPEVLERLMAQADLVIDATAEVGLHYPIATFAQARDVPYLEASTRAGAWGGVIARVMGGREGPCWLCYQYFLADHTQDNSPTRPLADASGLVQPTGCADPTFTGTGFDVASFALSAVRLAVGTLTKGQPQTYPDPPWDIAIVNLREPNGAIVTPVQHSFSLQVQPACPAHRR